MPPSKKRQSDYRIDALALLVGLVFFVIGEVIKISMGENVSIIGNSIKTPWGIVTSNFIYDGINNMEWYALFYISLFLSSIAYRSRVKRLRYLASLYSMFLAAIFANAIWLITIYINGSSLNNVGESAVVFGFVGACFSLFVLDSFATLSGFISKRLFRRELRTTSLKSDSKYRRWIGFSVSSFFLLAIVADLVNARVSFFNLSPRVNYLVHILAFSIGSIITFGMYGFGLLKLTRIIENPIRGIA